MKQVPGVSCLLIGALLSACGAEQAEEPGGAYGSWMTRPQAGWPKIALVNRIDYSDQHHPVAGCGFLLEVGEEVLAATAKHVLTYFKSPEMDSVDVKQTLQSWKMFPKDHPSDQVVLDALLNRDPRESLQRVPCGKDWLLFSVRQRSETIQPLRFSTTPLEKGEAVYVIGWRYTEMDCPQIVYEGVYVGSESDAVLISAEKLIDSTVGGLSGAPVIDERGYLIGAMSRARGRSSACRRSSTRESSCKVGPKSEATAATTATSRARTMRTCGP